MLFKRTRGKLASTTQAGIERLRKYRKGANLVLSNIAKVKAVHSDRATCDIQSCSGATKYNVPVRTKGGLINNEVYGELDLPAVGDHVIVSFLGSNESEPVIEGTVLPYLHSKFQSSQTPVNSSSKQFTKKLLEAEKEKAYRKIFKSGTTMEVLEDGTVIFETPSGDWIRISDANGEIQLNGDSKSLVTHAELNTALQSFVIALNATFATKLNGAGAAGTLSLNISTAEATKVKTS